MGGWTSTLFCMGLSTVTGWLCAALPVSQHARPQPVRHQPTVLQRHSAAAPHMCSDNSLSAEIEAWDRDTASQPKIMFGSPLDTLRQHKADGAYVLIFNRGQELSQHQPEPLVPAPDPAPALILGRPSSP